MKIRGFIAVLLMGAASICGAARAEGPASPPAAAATRAVPALAVPAPDAVLMMIRAHVLAVGQANAANNYEVLRAIGASTFRELNTAEGLSKTFAAVRDLHLDFSPIVVTTPVLTDPPSITDGKLRLYGAFPTQPIEVPFGMLFEQEAGAWKLNAISVGARPTAKVAELTMPMSNPAPAANEKKGPEAKKAAAASKSK